jgi:hypothetical protein
MYSALVDSMIDQIIKSEMRQARLDDPVYASSQGLSVLHFDLLDRTQSKLQPWLMISKNWGEHSHTVVDPVDDARLQDMLPDHCRNELKVCECVCFFEIHRVPTDPCSYTLKSTTSMSFTLGQYDRNQSQKSRSGLFDTTLMALFTTSPR